MKNARRYKEIKASKSGKMRRIKSSLKEGVTTSIPVGSECGFSRIVIRARRASKLNKSAVNYARAISHIINDEEAETRMMIAASAK